MPNPILIVFFSIAAFALAASSDWFETRYVRAVRRWEDGDDTARETAARSSVAMWLVGTVALVTVIEIGWFVLPFEALGLYVGTKYAMRRKRNLPER
jgi:hypothetical protein